MKLILITIAFLITYSSISQINFEDITTYNTNEHEIYQSDIYQFINDKENNLWMLSVDALVKYSNNNWEYLTGNNSAFLSFEYNSFTCDTNNKIFMGGFGRIDIFDGSYWQSYNLYNLLSINPAITFSYTDKVLNKKWFVADNSGLISFDDSIWTHLTITDGLLSNNTICVFKDSQGNLWTGYHVGISRFNNGNYTYFYSGTLGGSNVKSISEDLNGNIWIATDGGMAKYNGLSWELYDPHIIFGVLNQSVNDITFDLNNVLWAVSEENGIYTYDSLQWKNYNTDNTLNTRFLNSVFCDNQNKKWIGTKDRSLIRYYNENWEFWNTTSGLINNGTNSVMSDMNGKIWFGTYAGISIYDGIQWMSHKTEHDSMYHVSCIKMDNNSTIWIGLNFNEGAAKYSENSFTEIQSNPSSYILRGMVNDIIFENQYTWFATQKGGINRMEEIPNGEPQWIVYRSVNGLLSDTATALERHPNGDLYIGTWHGINILNNDTLSVLSLAEAHQGISEHITDLLFDDQNRLWVASTQGLAYYDGQDWATFNTGDSLADDYVNVIFEASDSSLWFGTNNGLSRYKNSQFKSWFKSDGLIADKVNDITEDLDHNLYFATDYGVSKLALNTLSISKPYNNEKAGLHVFPNPAKDKLHYELNGKEKGTFQVFDIKGTIRFENPNASPKGEINISMLPAGSYFLRFSGPDASVHYAHFVVIR